MINNLNFAHFLEHYKCAYIIADFKAGKILYTNQAAKDLYSITENTPDLEPTFAKNPRCLTEMFFHDMKKVNQGDVLITDVITLLATGEKQVADLHLGYFNLENSQVYVEIIPKISSPIAVMRKFVDQSSKPIFVLNLDDDLTVRYCSPKTRELYQVKEQASMADAFPSSLRKSMVQDILDYFQDKDKDTYYQHLQLNPPNKGILWYAMNLDQVDFDGDGKLLICTLTCIQEQISMKEELEDISQYFDILQDMCQGLLYRFDIHTRTLHRSEKTANIYHVPVRTNDFPSQEWLEQMLHKDDIKSFIAFMNQVVKGVDGSHVARLRNPEGKLEYHQFTFRAVRRNDGSIREMIGNAINVHRLKKTEEELSTVSQYFDILQSFSKDLLYRLDTHNRTLYRNESTSAYYGIPPVVKDYPNPQSLEGVFHPEDIDHYVLFIKEVLQGKEGTHTARLIAPSGNFEYHKFTFKRLETPSGDLSEMIGHAVNVHSMMELEMKATYDMLTNCLNKISFQEQVSRVLENSNIQERHALFFVDLDDFKGINDNLGHTFGDFLLTTVGSRLKNLIRDKDLVGRVGGDEFVLFLEDCGSDFHLEQRGISILESLQEEYLQNSSTAHICGSVGVAIYPHHGTTYETLYENADKALYHSKRSGKNLTTIYYKGLGD